MQNYLERILRQNPWWEGRRIETIEGLKKRKLFRELMKYLEKKQTLSVVGLRRTGKTILLLQLIQHLLKSHNPKKILYFSFDELLAKEPEIIESILSSYENEILRKELKDVYIFFDEINHIKDWQVVLKRFYDLNQNIKFIVTGSSSIQIKKAKESLAGRIYEFELKPLSFSEFLDLRGIEVKNISLQALTLKNEIFRYLMFGGFPELVNEEDFQTAKKYVASVSEKIIFYDIPKVYDVGNAEILMEIFKIISKNPGSIVEFNNIASALKISYQTASKYIHYLEEAFLIKSLYNFRGSPIATSRKAKKFYLSTTALALSVLESESEFASIIPKLAENAVVSHLNAKFFWLEYFELDVLHNKIPIEVKYTDSIDIKNNISAVKKLKLKELIVVTKNTEEKRQIEKISVRLVPLWKFLLEASL